MNSLLIAQNLLKRTIGRRRAWLYSLVLPLLVMSGVISFTDSIEQRAVIGIVNADGGALGERLLAELNDQPVYSFEAAADRQSLESFVLRGDYTAGMIVPERFSESLINGEQAGLVYITANESGYTDAFRYKAEQTLEKMRAALAAARQSGADEAQLPAKADEALRSVSAASYVKVNGSGMQPNFKIEITAGFLIMFLMMMNNGPISIMTEDRRNGTFERIFAAPVKSREIIAGQFLGSLLYGSILLIVLLAFSCMLPGFAFDAGFLQLLLVFECFLLASIGFSGVLAAAFGDTGTRQGINALAIIPTCMLGGCFWPVAFMPEWMQKLANFVPQKWAIDAVKQLYLGAQLSDVLPNLTILVLFGAVMLAFGSFVSQPVKALGSK